MRWFDILRMRLRSLFRRARVERELDEELRYHLDRETDFNIAQGMSPDEARFAALRDISDIELRREECRDMRRVNWIENAIADMRFAARQLRKEYEFTTTAMLMLALGLSASIAIFAFVDAALVKPLPYQDPDRLIGVFEKLEPQCRFCNLSWPDYLDWKRMNTTLESLDVYQGRGFALSTESGPQRAPAARVSDGFFRTLGVRPALGRDFYPGEDRAGAARTTILSYAAWQARYGGSSAILGKTVTLDRDPYVVVGVLPRDFQFAPVGQADFWVPLQASSECDLRRSCHGLYGVGRLKPGVSVDAARANFVSIARQLELQYPASNRDQGANALPLAEVIVGRIRPILLVLMAGSGLLLLIACVDVVGLVLVRAESRKREMAVRSALGASSGRLLAQLVAEALVLVAGGVAAGLAGAHLTMRSLSSMLSEEVLARMPFLAGAGWTPRVLLFAAAASLLCGSLFAFAPGLRLRSPHIRGSLAEGSRGSVGTVWRSLGSKLAVAELAMAVVLLVAAALLSQSLVNLLRVNLGLRPDRLVTVNVAAPNAKYATDPKAIALGAAVLEQASQLPGVVSVGLSANGAPLTHNGNTTWIRILGRPWDGGHIDVPEREVTPAWFSTIGAKLARGRFFTESDDSTKGGVAIVNQAFVRKHFNNGEAVGQNIGRVSIKTDPVEIVGVVEDIRQGSLDDEIPPIVYRPFKQSADTFFNLVARTSQDPGALIPELTAAIRRIDPEILTLDPATMQDRLERSNAAYMHRTTAWLVGGFAAVALVLALVGLYGVIAYSVSQRTREIGVRMALGARTGMVYRMILGEAAWLTAAGIAVGLGLAAAVSGLLRSLLFGVSPWDPATLASIAAVLAAAALCAAFAPARRAASVNPVDALRCE
ncbi:MAG: ABC transporter permease [Acidobacteria bacterium]|nr:ABC transporter permease [Acidobacteriota bacterium]